MPQRINILTDAALRKLRDSFRVAKTNTRRGPAAKTSGDHTAPPSFLFVIPDDGIAAADGAVLSSALCATQQIKADGTLRNVPGGRLLWNTIARDLTPGEIILGHVDAWGRYVTTTAGGSILFKAPTGGIPPRVFTLLGSATCDVWDLGTTAKTISDSTTTVEVLNWAPDPVCVDGDRYGVAVHWYKNTWLFIQEYCDNSTGGGATPGTGGGSGQPIEPLIPDGPNEPGNAAPIGTFLLSDPGREASDSTPPLE